MELKKTKSSRRRFLAFWAAAGARGALRPSRLFANSSSHARKSDTERSEMTPSKQFALSARSERNARKMASPQFRNGKFQNTVAEKIDTVAAFRKWVFAAAAHREPTGALPVAKRVRSEFEARPVSSLRMTWLGHASMLLEIDGKRFLTDPVWGGRASPFSFAGPKRFFAPPLPLSEIPKLDAIILSHNHYDHLCRDTIQTLVAQNVPFLVPLGVGNELEDLGVPNALIQEYDWWDEATVAGVRLACTPARHFSGRGLFDRNSTLWCSWCFLGTEERFFFSGDTAMFPGFKDIGNRYGPFDLVAMESGAYNDAWPDVHIGPEQALQAFQDLKGKVLLPIHWATFNLSLHNWTEPGERIVWAAKKQNVVVALPRPGESFEPRHLSAAVQQKWWPEVPWQTAEEAPIVSSQI